MKRISIILVLGILGMVFFRFGRSIYIPAINKLKGKETVESITDKIQNDVWDRLETNLNLAGYKMDYPDTIILVALKEEQKLQVYFRLHIR